MSGEKFLIMLNVTLRFQKSRHINQYIYGFLMLQKAGVIKIEKIVRDSAIKKNILRATVNGIKFVYDAEDGAQIERGFFSQADYNWCARYYKRSCSEKLAAQYPKCRPLGFNYSLTPAYGILDYLSQNIRRLRGKGDMRHKDLEALPSLSKQPKILFITGLWDPAEFADPAVQAEVAQITQNRLDALKVIKSHFAHCSTFGVNGNRDFTRQFASDMILAEKMTDRPYFIKVMKQHDICITTSGLHGSIGGRFGEYIAASRAIISEPLHYNLPGNFADGKNFLSFSDESSLVSSINHLLENHEARYTMMVENRRYYENSLRPDKLILNTLVNVE